MSRPFKVTRRRSFQLSRNALEVLEDRRLLAGLTADGNQIWHQGMSELPDGSVPAIEGLAIPFDQMGNVLAVGDFNGDTFPDLAIGSNENAFVANQGEDGVNILYGSSSGLTSRGNQRWDQDSVGLDEMQELGDRFGAALAAGDRQSGLCHGRIGFWDLECPQIHQRHTVDAW